MALKRVQYCRSKLLWTPANFLINYNSLFHILIFYVDKTNLVFRLHNVQLYFAVLISRIIWNSKIKTENICKSNSLFALKSNDLFNNFTIPDVLLSVLFHLDTFSNWMIADLYTSLYTASTRLPMLFIAWSTTELKAYL